MGKDIKLKRGVIKEELVKLTGNYKLALMLNQLLYWTERVGPNRYNLFAKEELSRDIDDTDNLKGGWIYKKAEQIAEELMLGITSETARNWLKELDKQEYIFSRKNPNQKWDHTKQYRVNLLKIQSELKDLGYSLEGYRDILEKRKKPLRTPKSPNQNNLDSKQNNLDSNRNNYDTIPEITSEITSDIIEEEEGENSKFQNLEKITALFGQVFDKQMQPFHLKLLNDFDYQDEIIIKALRDSGIHNAQSFQYTLKLLKNWSDRGITTLDEIERLQRQFKGEETGEDYEAKGYR